jgi:hypothetical protein
LNRLDADYVTRAEEQNNRMADEKIDARAEHQRRIRTLEERLTAEMDNVVGGEFKGPRYQEIEARLERAQAERERDLAALAQRHAEQGPAQKAVLAREHRQAHTLRVQQAESERHDLLSSDFEDDERAHDPRVVVFLRMTESVLGLRLTGSQFVFGLSASLSLLMELGILLAFETLVLTLGPVLAAQQREAVENEALMAEVAGDAERDAIRHGETMDRIRKKAERVVERAKAHAKVTGKGRDTSPSPEVA